MLEIYYNSKGLGHGYSSGSIRLKEPEILPWLEKALVQGPVLITHIEDLETWKDRFEKVKEAIGYEQERTELEQDNPDLVRRS